MLEASLLSVIAAASSGRLWKQFQVIRIFLLGYTEPNIYKGSLVQESWIPGPPPTSRSWALQNQAMEMVGEHVYIPICVAANKCARACTICTLSSCKWSYVHMLFLAAHMEPSPLLRWLERKVRKVGELWSSCETHLYTTLFKLH